MSQADHQKRPKCEVHVVHTSSSLGHDPVLIDCPSCGHTGWTVVDHSLSVFTGQ